MNPIRVLVPLMVIVIAASGCGIIYPTGRTDPIHDAVWRGNLPAVESLLDRGTNINATDGCGRTPLYWAAMIDRPEIASVLIKRGANVNKGASWKGHDTPLHVAANKGNEAIISILLDGGANVNVRSMSEQTPLHYAAWLMHPGAVSLLIARGADVNARDYQESTPLHVEYPYPIPKDWPAADYAKVVKILIAHGADVNARNKRGNTPLKIAKQIGNEAAVNELLAAGAKE